MGEFSGQVLHILGRAASAQGGVISGDNPTKYNASDPVRLWIIQIVIIISMTQFLALFLSRIRQPRVIAEVIGGVILGPSIMGHIPNFRNTIFPLTSIPLLTLTANIGLILFLFLVGLEIDVRLMRRNVLAAASVSVAGLVIPLGLGAALGVAVYKEFINPAVNFGYFILFVAVAIGITAFPVLCRILTELKLLDTEVGLVVLSAGIGNDVVGWIMLALTVALVNASSGLTALWVLLASAAYTIFLLYPGRWGYHWLAKRTGSLEQGSPTPFMMTVTLLIVFISAFFTDIIGVHAIFGGFLAGLIIPHKNGFAISIVEKLEDLVSIVFLPIYFMLSGLNTNLSLLNDGVTWGYVALICLVAFTSKFIACGAAAHFNGFNWREAGAIGSLMSCKGLVELIVLNIGLQANILNPRTFSMFVVHAIIITFMTTPLVLLFYPSKYRIHHRNDRPAVGEAAVSEPKPSKDDMKTRFALVLDKIEALPAALTLSQLLQAPSSAKDSQISLDEKAALHAKLSSDDALPLASPITIEALRLMELTNRTSAVLRSTKADSLIHNDPVVATYRTFGQLNNLNVSANLSVVNFDEFPEAIASHVAATRSEMLIIPWPRGFTSVQEEDSPWQGKGPHNPFDGLFHKTASEDQTSSVVYSEFIRNVFAKTPSDIALFVDRGMAPTPVGVNRQHLFLAFMGGPDDRLALSFLVQLCGRPTVTATVVRLVKTDSMMSGDRLDESIPSSSNVLAAALPTTAASDTVYPSHNTHTRLSSDLADNLIWDGYTTHPTASRSPDVALALSRISFHTESTPTPLRRITELVKEEVAESLAAANKTVIILAGRSRRLAVESLSGELSKLTAGTSMSSSVPKTLGDVGAALVATNITASLLILQATPSTL